MDAPVLNDVIKPIVGRDTKFVDADISAVRAIAEAAVHVELFTIPLYMTSMYSIVGMHEINSPNVSYYKGRQWPGMGTSRNATTSEEKAFNIIFSVYIQEMLHLQLAANIASAVGGVPTFSGKKSLLQNDENGWVCYGDKLTTIPHIIDLKDTSDYGKIKVKLGPLDKNQIELFKAIEQPESAARKGIKKTKRKKYFPAIPLEGWKASDTEIDLPLFGTIGYMYEALVKYLTIAYDDGSTLWERVYDPGSVQQDIFNRKDKGSHPKAEFDKLALALSANDTPEQALKKVLEMASAITDQGEGAEIEIGLMAGAMFDTTVADRNRPSKDALQADYPSYNASGKQLKTSADCIARFPNSKQTHYERFIEVDKMLKKINTWDKWHKKGKSWKAKDLVTREYKKSKAPDNIPTPNEVANALNALKTQAGMPDLMSQVATGAIAGVTTVLDTYWTDKNKKTGFPFPSMAGSGDRISIYWAVFGETPDLSRGVGAQDSGLLYHACQGMAFEPSVSRDECAAVEVYHTCRGSNSCKAQGGCGFVQPLEGGGSCGGNSCGAVTRVSGGSKHVKDSKGPYSAPSDNYCGGAGGCAVPISASQLYPQGGNMALYDFTGAGNSPERMKGELKFSEGDSVYDTAWEAYSEVMKKRGQKPKEKPQPNDLRIALPPST